MTIKNVVFIDSRVTDYSALAAYTELDSIQLVSRGSTGLLQLGTTVLESGNLGSYQTQLQTIGQSLTATGDILLYASDVGAGTAGAAFVSALSTASGADVAASDDLTGAASLSGDWILETTSGMIESHACRSYLRCCLI